MSLLDDFAKNIEFHFYPYREKESKKEGSWIDVVGFYIVYYRATVRGFKLRMDKKDKSRYYVQYPFIRNARNNKIQDTFKFMDWAHSQTFLKLTIKKYEGWKQNKEEIEKI